ncbi:uncharacterized protein L201_004889 [Kwoniella dendrophila CBS 6074]|uniref:Bromo domain-containing protein n=1 Tax=Kwoniella dendrophila CBS 6074 TaxID=1295534 RepID=A0AAX4JZE8_9TREE
MKYLLNFLEGIPDAPNLSDPEFQQLLLEVQAGKSSNKSSADAFYDSLEKIVNELKSTPESLAFQKPVSKRDYPDYYEVIKKPMDLTTILRNVKSKKYKNKSEFASDLSLIWENCYEYNSQETHPIRAAARYMKQKAEHHLEFLADKNEKPLNPLQALLPQGFNLNGSPMPGLSSSSSTRGGLGENSNGLNGDSLTVTGGDEDAAGESDDGQNADDQGFRESGGTLDGGGTMKDQEDQTRGNRRGSSVASTSRSRMNGTSRRSPPAFRPQLNNSLDAAPALIRTPYTMTHFMPVSLNQPGPSFQDKGKAKEILYGNAPPSWFPMPSASSSSSSTGALAGNSGLGYDDEDLKLEGYWWGAMSASNEDALISGMPSIPQMVDPVPTKKKRIKRFKSCHQKSPLQALVSIDGVPTSTVSTSPGKQAKKKPKPKVINTKRMIYETNEKLHESRNIINRIQEFQRIEYEGGILPSNILESKTEKLIKKEEKFERIRNKKEEKLKSIKRKNQGGEMGEEQAVLQLKKSSAALLAHNGFEGANEAALDLFTRVAVDHISNMGRTFRLLIDGFSNRMTSEEIILHALHENGQIETQDLEAHLKDEIERESVKVTEMQRKIRQAFKEVTTAPVIDNDMLLANNGEMLLDGNFADELGEDFLGLRDLGIDKEFGLSTLTVPSSLFYGRRRKLAAANGEGKEDLPDYPPPPTFIPLNLNTLSTQLPGLLHQFFNTRFSDSGLTIIEDDLFDHSHSQIGSLGQIIYRNNPTGTTGDHKTVNGNSGTGAGGGSGVNKKKRERENNENGIQDGHDEEKKKKVSVKEKVPGVGKGNWVRPSKEEKARRLAEKQALIDKDKDKDKEQDANQKDAISNGKSSFKVNGTINTNEQEEDAEGEEGEFKIRE